MFSNIILIRFIVTHFSLNGNLEVTWLPWNFIWILPWDFRYWQYESFPFVICDIIPILCLTRKFHKYQDPGFCLPQYAWWYVCKYILVPRILPLFPSKRNWKSHSSRISTMPESWFSHGTNTRTSTLVLFFNKKIVTCQVGNKIFCKTFYFIGNQYSSTN